MDAATIRAEVSGPRRNAVSRGSGTEVSASATMVGTVQDCAKCILCGSGDAEVFRHLYIEEVLDIRASATFTSEAGEDRVVSGRSRERKLGYSARVEPRVASCRRHRRQLGGGPEPRRVEAGRQALGRNGRRESDNVAAVEGDLAMVVHGRQRRCG
jgi:hypothetical protein